MTYTPEDIKNLIVKYYPDMRKMLNVLQMSVKDDAVVLDDTVLTSNNYIKEVLKDCLTTLASHLTLITQTTKPF